MLAPIVKLADRSRNNSRQVSLTSDERVWEWFEARATNIGLMVDPFRARFEKARVYPKGRSNKHIFFTQVRFEGIASIADPEKVKLALETGMAGKKAFGFGMLNLLSMGK